MYYRRHAGPISRILRNVRKNFSKTGKLWRGAAFTVEAGELFGLLGPNGAGKTTLLSIVACLTDVTAGEVFFDGKPLNRSATAPLRGRRSAWAHKIWPFTAN